MCPTESTAGEMMDFVVVGISGSCNCSGSGKVRGSGINDSFSVKENGGVI